MVGDSYRGEVVRSTPSFHNASACECSGARCLNVTCDVVDLLLLRPERADPLIKAQGLVVRVVSSFARPLELALELGTGPSGAACNELAGGFVGWACETLACGSNASATNTFSDPEACVPKPLLQGAAWAQAGTEHRTPMMRAARAAVR